MNETILSNLTCFLDWLEDVIKPDDNGGGTVEPDPDPVDCTVIATLASTTASEMPYVENIGSYTYTRDNVIVPSENTFILSWIVNGISQPIRPDVVTVNDSIQIVVGIVDRNGTIQECLSNSIIVQDDPVVVTGVTCTSPPVLDSLTVGEDLNISSEAVFVYNVDGSQVPSSDIGVCRWIVNGTSQSSQPDTDTLQVFDQVSVVMCVSNENTFITGCESNTVTIGQQVENGVVRVSDPILDAVSEGDTPNVSNLGNYTYLSTGTTVPNNAKTISGWLINGVRFPALPATISEGDTIQAIIAVDDLAGNTYEFVSNLVTVSPASMIGDLTIVSNGITANFRNVVSFGQYINGDYWINGGGNNVELVSFSPASIQQDRITANGTNTGVVWTNGAQIDPGKSPSGTTLADKQAVNYGFSTGDPGQGYDQFVGVNNLQYDHTLNVDPGATGNSIVISEGTIVKYTSDQTNLSNNARSSTDGMAFFTVVTSEPAANSFRPSPALASKASVLNFSDIDLSVLPNWDVTGVNLPTISTYTDELIPLNFQHTYNALSRNLMDDDSFIVYGGEFDQVTEAMLGMCFNAWSNNGKEDLAIRIIQYAIDIAGRMMEGGIKQDNGGHPTGWKSIVAFANALVGGHPFLESVLSYTAQGPNYGPKPTPVGASVWADDTQHGIITQAIIDEPRNLPYQQSQLGHPEWSGDATRNPTSDWENSLGVSAIAFGGNAGYRHIIAGVNVPAALALRAVGAYSTFNNPVFFDYQDRYMAARIANGGMLPDAGSARNDIELWVIDAWQNERAALGGVWTP